MGKNDAAMHDARAEQYAKFINDQQKSDPGSIFRLDDDALEGIEIIPTGAVALDIALGVGGLPRGRIVELFGPEMSGKCLTAGTSLWTDCGLETIEEFFARLGHETCVAAKVTDIRDESVRLVNEDGALETVEALTHNHIKDTIRITLASGRTVEATENHPLRVLNDQGYVVWKNVGTMQEGDVVVSAMFGAEQSNGNSGLSLDEAAVLGYLAVGGSSEGDFVRFATTDIGVAADYSAMMEHAMGVKVEELQRNVYGVRSKDLHNALATHYGLTMEGPENRQVPYKVRTGGAKVQASFLAAVYEGGGWSGRELEIGVTMASETLARQIQLLLLGLGIPADFAVAYDETSGGTFYNVGIAPNAVKRFLDLIGFRVSNRTSRVAMVMDSDRGHEALPNVEPAIRSLCDMLGGYELDEVVGDCPRDRLMKVVGWAKNQKPREAAQALIQRLEQLADSPFTYERVVKVEDAGKQPTFDVVVPETHSFIANGIISHNTSLALAVAAQAQKMGGFVGVIDAEHAFSREFAIDAFGIDETRLALAQPDDGIQALRMTERMAASGAFDVIIIDSVAALLPPAMAEAEIGDSNQLGQHAKMMSDGLRKLTPVVAASRAVVIFINQIRMNPGAYGNPETTTGGRALGFYSSVRLEVRSPASKRITQGTTPVGQVCQVKIKKNKVAPPHREATYELYYDSGIAFESSLLEAAEEVGVITRAGASYTEVATGERIGVGKEHVKQALLDDFAMRERITDAVYATAGVARPVSEETVASPEVVDAAMNGDE